MALNAPAQIHYNYDDQILEIGANDADDSKICIPIDKIVEFGFPSCGGSYKDAKDVERSLEAIVRNYDPKQ